MHTNLDLWPPKSNQFIVGSKWTFVPILKKFPPGVPEASHLQWWDVQTMENMTPPSTAASGAEENDVKKSKSGDFLTFSYCRWISSVELKPAMNICCQFYISYYSVTHLFLSLIKPHICMLLLKIYRYHLQYKPMGSDSRKSASGERWFGTCSLWIQIHWTDHLTQLFSIYNNWELRQLYELYEPWLKNI